LALAESARAGLGDSGWPKSIVLGTGWGALSETWNFLARLTESEEQFPSPTDFVGSVHNGPASQVAIHLGATGPNVTASGGDASFEQALFLAWLLGGDEPRLVLGADEGHEAFSPLLDPSSPPGALLADGGGALVLRPDPAGAICGVSRPVMVSSPFVDGLPSLIGSLGGPDRLRPGCAAVLAGIPAAEREQGETRLAHFLQATGITAPVIRFRDWVGQFASASAVAASLAVSFFQHNCLPGSLTGQADRSLDQRPCHILVLGLGRTLSAMEFFRS
jgi:hypothetical protein